MWQWQQQQCCVAAQSPPQPSSPTGQQQLLSVRGSPSAQLGAQVLFAHHHSSCLHAAPPRACTHSPPSPPPSSITCEVCQPGAHVPGASHSPPAASCFARACPRGRGSPRQWHAAGQRPHPGPPCCPGAASTQTADAASMHNNMRVRQGRGLGVGWQWL
jgi:hypothetical protein